MFGKGWGVLEGRELGDQGKGLGVWNVRGVWC